MPEPQPQPHPTSPRFNDLTGKKFYKLTVLFYAGKNDKGYTLWHCRCACGRERTVVAGDIGSRTTACRSCSQVKKKKGWQRLEFRSKEKT